MKAAMAITSEKKSNGESNIKPPGNLEENSSAIGPASGRTSSNLKCRPAVSAVRPLAPPAHPQARRRPLLQHLAAKPKQRGGPAAGLCRHHAGWVNQGAGFHQ